MTLKQWSKMEILKYLFKLRYVIFTVILSFLACPTVTYAYGPAVTEVAPTVTPMGEALTPEGNLTLVDDIFTNNEGDKQFITAVSKSGNYFYLVIDRAGDDNNVYLLNLVDEADLVALTSGEPVPMTDDSQQVTTDTEVDTKADTEPDIEPEPEPLPVEEPEEVKEDIKKSSLVPLLCLLAVVVIGAFYYFKIYKKEPQLQLDGLEYDDEEEEDPFGVEHPEDEEHEED